MPIIALDLDNCLVEERPSNEIFDAPGIQSMIDFANSLYDLGNIIYVYTARGLVTKKIPTYLLSDFYYEKTKKQLKRIGLKYHHLVLGKLPYDYLICDKAYNVKDLSYLKSILLPNEIKTGLADDPDTYHHNPSCDKSFPAEETSQTAHGEETDAHIQLIDTQAVSLCDLLNESYSAEGEFPELNLSNHKK